MVESRRHEIERREVDWSSVPFANVKIPSSFLAAHEPLIMALGFAICLHARDNVALTDPDIIAALQALGETYQTLSNGIYYEKAPDYILQRGLFEALKTAIEDYKKLDSRKTGLSAVHDSEIRDAVIFLTQLGATRSNGRPKGRASLDFLRSQFKSEDLRKPSSSQLVFP